MTAPIPVRPGQIWADLHPNSKGRTVRVVSVDLSRALVEVVTMSDVQVRTMRGCGVVGRKSRVLIGRGGLKRYRLVSEPDDTAGSTT